MRVGVGRLSAPTRPSSSQRFSVNLWLPSPWIAPSFGRTDHSPHRTVREDFPHTVPRHRTFPYGEVARHRRQPASSVSIRTPAQLIPVSAFPGTYPALYPPFHDLGPRQRVRRHHPPKRSPRHLPASTAVQPVPPRTRCRIVHQVEAWAIAPHAVILVVPTQLRTQSYVLFLGCTVAVVPAPAPELAQGAAEPLALRLSLDGVAASPGFAPIVDKA